MINHQKQSLKSFNTCTCANFLLIISLSLCIQVLVECSSPYNITTSQNIIDGQVLDKSVRIKLRQLNLVRSTCGRAEENLDRCSAQLIAFGANQPAFPVSMEELESIYCPNFKKVVSCIKDNAKCLKPFQRQILDWILTSTRRMNYKRCKNDNEKIRFLKLTSSCMSVMRNPADKCMNNYIANVDAIANLSQSQEEDTQIQLSCCANRRFKDCVMTYAKHTCRPTGDLIKLKRISSVSSSRMVQRRNSRAMQDMMEDLRSTLDSMTLTGPEFICQSVDEKFCRNQFDGKFSGPALHKSIVPAMLKIYSNKP